MLTAETALNHLKQRFDQLRLEDLSQEVIEDLRDDLVLLEYLIQPRRGISLAPPTLPEIGAPVCSAAGCKAGWREGLVNFASPDRDPVWYCLLHGEQQLELISRRDEGLVGHLPGWPHSFKAKMQNAQRLKEAAEAFLQRGAL